MHCTLTPCGRDYRTKKSIIASLEANEDFRLHDMASQWDGSRINLPQLRTAGYHTVNVRYGQLRKVCVIDLRKVG